MSFPSRAVVLSLFALSACLLPLAASAQAPSLINYQGRLLNGTNLASGNVGLSLRLFNVVSGGTKQYEDSNSVTIVDGLYATFIGDNTNFGTLTNALTNATVYVEVVVNGTVLTPRERLASVAYTLRAQTAQTALGVAANSITAAMIATGAVQAVHLATGAVTTVSLADGAVSGTKIASNTITTANVLDGGLQAEDFATTALLAPPVYVPNPAPALGDEFGRRIARVDTNRFLVGAPYQDGGTTDAGRAYMYNLDGTLRATVFNPTPSAGDEFGQSLAGVGFDGFVVGAPYNDGGAPDAGSVYLYASNGLLTATVANPAPGFGDAFGWAVASVGPTRFVVGAPYDDIGAPDVGRAYLYDLTGTLLATITNPAPTFNDRFGLVLADVGATRFVVGVPNDDAGAADAGSVYLYNLVGTLLATITNPAPAVGDSFGASVAAVGTDRFVVGAPVDSAGAPGAGSAYLYDLNGTLLATITNPAPAEDDFFGLSVAGVGTNGFVVGVPYSDVVGATNVGRVHYYDLNGTLLATIPNPDPAVNADFGFSVAGVGEDLLAVGVPSARAGLFPVGGAYLYDPDSLTVVVTGLVSESIAANAVGVRQLDTASVDERYVLKAGDVMTGDLKVPANGFRVGIGQLVVTNGSVGVGTAEPEGKLHVDNGSAGAVTAAVDSVGIFESAGNSYVSLLAPTNANSGIIFGTEADNNDAGIYYNTSDARDLRFRTGGNAQRMTITPAGNVGIGTTSPTNKLHVAGTVQATAYITGSDAAAKENIAPVSVQEVLEKVAGLPIATWTFRDDHSGRHLGPMAQDFRAAFGLGNTDSGIFTVDADGVALAAIQALNSDVRVQKSEVSRIQKESDAKIEALQRTILELQARLQALEAGKKRSDGVAE